MTKLDSKMPLADLPLSNLPLSDMPLDDAILAVLARAHGKTLSAPEIAQGIATAQGSNTAQGSATEGDWHALLVPIRRTAVNLAQAGRLVIYRKGKPADPNDFRGVYRLGLPRHD